MRPIIKVENVGKQYLLGETRKPYLTLRESLVERLTSPFKRSRRASDENKFWALNDVSFEINPGEVVGIIGKNGAGKSTLLKILSRITEPTTGKVELYGRVASLLEVGTGFHPELTGRENIFLNGAILGMKREEISRKFDEIVDFAEVEKFIDTPVKHYSSGMYVRLAFAVASSLEPEILIVDEVLAVGDVEFQRKCLGKMGVVAEDGRTVIFVSHNMGAINQLCKKGIYLESGETKHIGVIGDVIASYLKKSGNESRAFIRKNKPEENEESKVVYFEKVALFSDDNTEKYKFNTEESIHFKFEIHSDKIRPNVSVFLMILNREKIPVCAFESDGIKPKMTLRVEPAFLTRGLYSIHAFLHTPAQTQFDIIYDELSFEIEDFSSKFVVHGNYNYSSVFGKGEWLYH